MSTSKENKETVQQVIMLSIEFIVYLNLIEFRIFVLFWKLDNYIKFTNFYAHEPLESICKNFYYFLYL